MRMLPYSLEAAYDLIYTLRDLRRTLVLVRSGLLTFFPEETDGLQHIYGIIERERSPHGRIHWSRIVPTASDSTD